jgi:hypothetical protein
VFRSRQHLASLKSKNRRSLSNRSCLIFCSIYFSLPVMILLCHSSELFEYAMAYLNDLTSASLAFVHEEEMTSTADTGRCDYGLKIVSEWLSYLQSLSLLRPWTPTAAQFSSQLLSTFLGGHMVPERRCSVYGPQCEGLIHSDAVL